MEQANKRNKNDNFKLSSKTVRQISKSTRLLPFITKTKPKVKFLPVRQLAPHGLKLYKRNLWPTGSSVKKASPLTSVGEEDIEKDFEDMLEVSKPLVISMSTIVEKEKQGKQKLIIDETPRNDADSSNSTPSSNSNKNNKNNNSSAVSSIYISKPSKRSQRALEQAFDSVIRDNQVDAVDAYAKQVYMYEAHQFLRVLLARMLDIRQLSNVNRLIPGNFSDVLDAALFINLPPGLYERVHDIIERQLGKQDDEDGDDDNEEDDDDKDEEDDIDEEYVFQEEGGYKKQDGKREQSSSSSSSDGE